VSSCLADAMATMPYRLRRGGRRRLGTTLKRRWRRYTSRFEARGLEESSATEDAARSGSSIASTLPTCTPRCLGRRSFRTRSGKAEEVSVDGGGDKAKADEHPLPIHGGGVCGGGRIGGCLALNQLKAFCARDGGVRETRLELAFSRYETYDEKIREVYRPKGLLAFITTAREYAKAL
jgi:hypothetical protein